VPIRTGKQIRARENEEGAGEEEKSVADTEIRNSSYLKLKKSIGIIGMALPFVLLLGMVLVHALVKDTSPFQYHYPESISHYYYSVMRGVFVGALCSVALFMFYYPGYGKKADNITGNLAGTSALLVAWFPTTRGHEETTWHGMIHYSAAALFFACLAYFCIKLFTRTAEGKVRTARKLSRDKIYRTCGWSMVFLMVLMALYSFVIEEHFHIHYFIWAGEAIALFLFGISWLTKGGSFYADPRPVLTDQG